MAASRRIYADFAQVLIRIARPLYYASDPSLTLFEETPILQALQESDSQEELLDPGNQLILFDF